MSTDRPDVAGAGAPDAPVALVTGAARGIGAATARRLCANGWRIVAVDRCRDDTSVPYGLGTDAELEALVAELGDAAIGVVGDVRSVTEMPEAVAAAVATFGGLDAVVANAGVVVGGTPLWEMSHEAWEVQLDINVTGVFNTIAAAVPALLARPVPRRGRVVVVASAAGLAGHERLAGYNATKAAVIGMVRGLAADLGDAGITANAVCPGSTRTPILDASARVYDLADVEEFAVHHPLGRLLEPDEVAAAIAFLCSQEAAGITGAVVPVDAGMTA